MYITPYRAERTIAIPVPKGESMPVLPVAGVHSLDDAAALPGSRLVDFALFNPSSRPADVAPGQATGTFVVCAHDLSSQFIPRAAAVTSSIGARTHTNAGGREIRV